MQFNNYINYNYLNGCQMLWNLLFIHIPYGRDENAKQYYVRVSMLLVNIHIRLKIFWLNYFTSYEYKIQIEIKIAAEKN